MLPSRAFPFVIRIGGAPLPPTMSLDIEEVVVNTSLHMPHMCTIRLLDSNVTGTSLAPVFKHIDNPLITIGAPLSVSAMSTYEGTIPVPSVPTPIFTGEITSVEADFGQGGRASLIIRAYDKSHRLRRGKKTATYLMMPDSLIAQKVMAAAGVQGVAMPTGAPREYVLQNNQSDWDFLQELAERNGFVLVMNALGVLQFKPANAPLGAGATLHWGQNLLSFRPRLTAYGQDSTVLVQGWDPKLKMPISGMFVPPPPTYGGGATQLALAASRTMLGISKDVVTDRPMGNMAEATAVAKARALDIASDFVQADGECIGEPKVQAGYLVTMMRLGTKYSGTYLVTSATHIFRPGTGYLTEFSISGSRSEALADLLKKDGDERGRFWGVVVGVVTNNMDPLQLGRVKVKFPFLGNAPPIESHWCRIAAPMGGKMYGFYAIPEVNDEVLVAFEHGDPNFPYIVGSLWNNLDRPPKPTSAVVVGGKVTKRILRTPAGHEITLDDTPGKELISIVDKSMMNKIEIDTTQKSISISVMGNCEINSKTGDIKIGATAKDVTIDCLNFKVNAKANVEIGAMAAAKIESKAKMDLKTTGQMTVEGTAQAVLKNAAAEVALNGPMVSMNKGALEVM